MADIPGIIEGAHEGRGLGLRFLRHIERNSLLLFIVPCDSADIMKEYKTLVNELKKYSPALMDKKRILGISKCDMMDDELLAEMKKDMKKHATKLKGVPLVFFSSAAHTGIPALLDTVWKNLDK
jgi:GTP-binding protein